MSFLELHGVSKSYGEGSTLVHALSDITLSVAARQLFGNPNPSALVQAWPMQHPIDASLLWSFVLLAIFAPLASFLYRRRTTG